MNADLIFHGIIVAAGRGVRAGLGVAKQFAMLDGKPMVRWSVEAMLAHPACVAVTVVVGVDDEATAGMALAGLAVTLVTGGAERRDSVLAGLASVEDAALVLIHDAARPGLDARVIDRLLAAFGDKGVAGAVPVMPMVDTLARSEGEIMGAAVDRAVVMRVQTPQAFRLTELRRAHAAWSGEAVTDDAQIVRAAGMPVVMVAGSGMLEKITLPGDIERVQQVMAGSSTMTSWRHAAGSGYDVHRLIAGDGLWLGGVWIAHDRGLEGHSDADVALHAITDALLGAIGEGDIGQHFPPSDPIWRGAASDRFLAHACALARGKGGRIDHVDCTIICEAPKVGPHRDAIRARIAEICGLPLDHVSVKATTTERLGFTGRGEGIAAQAVASVALPMKKEATA